MINPLPSSTSLHIIVIIGTCNQNAVCLQLHQLSYLPMSEQYLHQMAMLWHHHSGTQLSPLFSSLIVAADTIVSVINWELCSLIYYVIVQVFWFKSRKFIIDSQLKESHIQFQPPDQEHILVQLVFCPNKVNCYIHTLLI